MVCVGLFIEPALLVALVVVLPVMVLIEEVDIACVRIAYRHVANTATLGADELALCLLESIFAFSFRAAEPFPIPLLGP